MDVIVRLRDRKAERFIRDGELRVTAVNIVAGEARVLAQILAAAAAVAARGVNPTEPRNSHAIADSEAVSARATRPDDADDLVSQDQGKFGPREFAVVDV